MSSRAAAENLLQQQGSSNNQTDPKQLYTTVLPKSSRNKLTGSQRFADRRGTGSGNTSGTSTGDSSRVENVYIWNCCKFLCVYNYRTMKRILKYLLFFFHIFLCVSTLIFRLTFAHLLIVFFFFSLIDSSSP